MAKKQSRQLEEQLAGESADFKFDYEVYEKVSMAAQLRDIKLIASQYAIKPDIMSVLEDLENMKHGFFGESVGFYFDEDSGIASGKYRWTSEIKSGRKKALKLVSEYLVVYSNLQGFDEGHVEFYYNKVGKFATYPYFRALFSHHSSESGIMLPPLPTLSERVD